MTFTIKKARRWMAFGTQTLVAIRKRLVDLGLSELLSAKFRASTFQLLSRPYEKQRRRRIDVKKRLSGDGIFTINVSPEKDLSFQGTENSLIS